MAYFLIESHVKQRVHDLGKQLSAEGLAALERVVEHVLIQAASLSSRHARIVAAEIEVAAGMSPLAIKAKGRR